MLEVMFNSFEGHDDMEQLKEDNASLKQAVLDLQSQLDHMEKKVDALTQFALYKSRYIPGVDENCVVVIDGAVEVSLYLN